jgi:predicted nucleic acid-binding protein
MPRRGRITEATSARFVALLRQLPILVDSGGIDMTSVLAAGRRHQLTAYEATYLVLAQREGVPLATLDARMQQAARAAGVPLMAGG